MVGSVGSPWHTSHHQANAPTSVCGSALVAPATRAAAMLLEAFAAIDRFITARLEGHLRLLPAIRADRGIHLPRATVAIAASAPSGALAGRAALWAAAG